MLWFVLDCTYRVQCFVGWKSPLSLSFVRP
jgi:hypothetical protein